MAVPLTFTQIKALTEVGDSPTNPDRADVWDSIEYYIQQALDIAADSLALANAATAAVAANPGPPVFGSMRDIGLFNTVAKNHGCTIAAVGFTVTVTFTAAFADTNYVVMISKHNGTGAITITRNTGSVVIAGTNTMTSLDFCIFN